MIVGTERLVEAGGCDKSSLRDEKVVGVIIDAVIADLGLRSIGSIWHTFEGEGGVTGLVALTESHLACHTYPEYGTATFNLYCCRARPEWDWKTNLKSLLGAQTVTVAKIQRGEADSQASNPISEAAGGER